MYDIMYDIKMNSAVEVAHCRFKRRMFKIGDAPGGPCGPGGPGAGGDVKGLGGTQGCPS